MAKELIAKCPSCGHVFRLPKNLRLSILRLISKRWHTSRYVAGELGATRVGILWWLKRLIAEGKVDRTFRDGKYLYRKA